MIGLLQRVTRASVIVDDRTLGSIDQGILALIGIEKNDTVKNAERLLEKIICYRIFPDTEGRMNLDLKSIKGGLLLVPQFTLAADTQRGLRPGFSSAASPEFSQQLFEHLVGYAGKKYQPVESGQFGADMQVHLVNDGPVTFWLNI